ncbi:MAG: thiol:disulfide interchange protein DsbA/DsbL [Pseudomonadales bacterium]
MAKKQSKAIVQQKAALAAFGVLVAAIAAYLLWLTVADVPQGEFVEGEHYQIVDNPRRIRSDKIEVMEFFSYACIHCYNFDPDLTDWVEAQGERVNFVRMPAVANEYWRLLGRHYFTLEALNEVESQHMNFFREIHDGRKTFPTPDALAASYASGEPARATYLQAFNSTEVTSNLTRADQMARRLKIASVPTVVIQGKYIVRTTREIGPKRMLDVMDFLVEKERQALETAPTQG